MLPNVKTVTCDEWLRMPVVSDAVEEVVNEAFSLANAKPRIEADDAAIGVPEAGIFSPEARTVKVDLTAIWPE